MKPQIRKATPRDLASILDLHETAFSFAWEQTGRQFNARFVRAALIDAFRKEIALVAVDKGRVVGFVWAKKTRDYFGTPHGEICILLVRPSRQRNGIGTLLLKHAEKKLGTPDVRLSVLTINPAVVFYVARGYRTFLRVLRKTAR